MSKSDLGGVWRTVGGRRIFIKDGEDLSTAMKSSGKFNTNKKPIKGKSDDAYETKVYGSDVRKADERMKEVFGDDFKYKEDLDKIDKTTPETREIDGNLYEKTNGGWVSKEVKDHEREMMKKVEDHKRKMMEKEKNKLGKDLSYKDDSDSGLPEKRDDKSTLNDNDKRYSEEGKARYKAQVEEARAELQARDSQSRINYQKGEIEKASGLKVKKAFETDQYGNGKADRFELQDGRFVEHSKESLGAKDDTWSINEVKNGSIESRDFKSYNDMIKHLSGSNNSKTNTGYSQKQLDDVWKKEDYSEVISELKNSELNKMRQAAHDMNTTTPGTPGHENAKEYLQEMENKAATKFLDRQKSTANKVASHKAYKNAFEEYKKKHPNTKLNLQKFIDMSEGK